MGDKVTVPRADIDAIIEDVCIGCYETAIKHLGAMLDAPSAAEPVAWQYRLIGPNGPTKWRECDEAVRAMIAETGHYNGVREVPAELRPLYEGIGLTPHSTAVSAIAQGRDVGKPVAWLDMRHEPADWTKRVVATNPQFVENNGRENFQPLYLHPTTSPSAISEAPTSAAAVTPNPPEVS